MTGTPITTTSKERSDFLELFKIKVETIAPQPKQIITLMSNMNVRESLQTLAAAKILSAPVIDPTDETSILTIVSIVDIMVFLIDRYNQSANGSTFDLNAETSRANKACIGDIIKDIPPHDKFQSISKGTYILQAIQHFAKGAHRCPIIDNDVAPKFYSILTQSAIISKMATSPKSLRILSRIKIGDIQLGTAPVQSVSIEMKAFEAFSLMREKKISGLAIVDKDNCLVGNISARDLVETTNSGGSHMSKWMNMNLRTYIQHIHENENDIRRPAISCSPDTPLSSVIVRLATNRIHRIYVADQSQHPLRIISLRDVLSYLLKFYNALTRSSKSSSSSSSSSLTSKSSKV